MDSLLLRILDWFFLIFHTVWSIFNSAGWAFRATRKIHLATISLTAASWFILGIRYGWGFCPCTDWHWQVREALGEPVQSASYIHFLIYEITGINLPPGKVDTAVMAIFFAAAILSVVLNLRDHIRRRD